MIRTYKPKFIGAVHLYRRKKNMKKEIFGCDWCGKEVGIESQLTKVTVGKEGE